MRNQYSFVSDPNEETHRTPMRAGKAWHVPVALPVLSPRRDGPSPRLPTEIPLWSRDIPKSVQQTVVVKLICSSKWVRKFIKLLTKAEQ